jgi:hypothetical protein
LFTVAVASPKMTMASFPDQSPRPTISSTMALMSVLLLEVLAVHAAMLHATELEVWVRPEILSLLLPALKVAAVFVSLPYRVMAPAALSAVA